MNKPLDKKATGIVNAVGSETLSPAMAQISNYFNWVYDAMAPSMGERVLEVGPGFGNLGERILQSNRQYLALDSDAQMVETLRRRLSLTSQQALVGDIREPDSIAKIVAWKPDTLISMNVLEHQEQDAEHLTALMRFDSVKRFIFFVPALQVLYGTMDQQAGHFRRYSRNGFRGLLLQKGARNIKISYFNGLGAVAWWMAGRVFGCQTNSEATNQSIVAYDRYAIPAARFLDPLLSRFIGQSLLAYAENPAPRLTATPRL